MFSRRPIK